MIFSSNGCHVKSSPAKTTRPHARNENLSVVVGPSLLCKKHTCSSPMSPNVILIFCKCGSGAATPTAPKFTLQQVRSFLLILFHYSISPRSGSESWSLSSFVHLIFGLHKLRWTKIFLSCAFLKFTRWYYCKGLKAAQV